MQLSSIGYCPQPAGHCWPFVGAVPRQLDRHKVSPVDVLEEEDELVELAPVPTQ